MAPSAPFTIRYGEPQAAGDAQTLTSQGGGSEVGMTAELFLEVGRIPPELPFIRRRFGKLQECGTGEESRGRRGFSPAGGGTCSAFLVLSGSRGVLQGYILKESFLRLTLLSQWQKLVLSKTGRKKKKPTAASGPLFQLQLQQKENRFSRSFFIFMGLKRSCSDSRRRSKLHQSVFPFGPNPGKPAGRCLKGRRGGNIKQSR